MVLPSADLLASMKLCIFVASAVHSVWCGVTSRWEVNESAVGSEGWVDRVLPWKEKESSLAHHWPVTTGECPVRTSLGSPLARARPDQLVLTLATC